MNEDIHAIRVEVNRESGRPTKVVRKDMRRARQVDRVVVRDSRGKGTSSGLRDKGEDKKEEDAVKTKARGEDFQSIIATGVKRM